jgi:hypothetical protein
MGEGPDESDLLAEYYSDGDDDTNIPEESKIERQIRRR